MLHEFRTIEAFVQMLERLKSVADELAERSEYDQTTRDQTRGEYRAYAYLLDVVRTSNLGIVYPPVTVEVQPARDTSQYSFTCGEAIERFEQAHWIKKEFRGVILNAFRAGWDARDAIKVEIGK